jgi:hypothetical protein
MKAAKTVVFGHYNLFDIGGGGLTPAEFQTFRLNN